MPALSRRAIVRKSSPAQARRVPGLCLGLIMGALAATAAVIPVAIVDVALAQFPMPSPYRVAWEIDIEVGTPRRIVVDIAGESSPRAFWYLPYRVTNNTDREQLFIPVFELLTEDGRVIRSDQAVPLTVFAAIKQQLGNELLEQTPLLAGTLRVGPDQARDGVAIWAEPTAEMGRFSIFVSGLSGETATVKGPGDKDFILRKTLQLNYHIRGDEVFPGDDEVNIEPQKWIMR